MRAAPVVSPRVPSPSAATRQRRTGPRNFRNRLPSPARGSSGFPDGLHEPDPRPSRSKTNDNSFSNDWALIRQPRKQDACYVRQTLEDGQEVVHPGTVIIFGDVMDGATIKAGKDIIIWGRLLGSAHAGSRDGRTDPTAVICCLGASPTTVSIGNVFRVDIQKTLMMNPKGTESPVLMHVGPENKICTVLPKDETVGMPHERHIFMRDNSTFLASAITGAYISLVGISLMLAPLSVFGILFDASKIAVGWIRVFGVLCVTFGTYYLGTALGDAYGRSNSFYASTIFGRIFVAVSLSIIVALGELSPTVLVLALVNLLGAMSMWNALKNARKL